MSGDFDLLQLVVAYCVLLDSFEHELDRGTATREMLADLSIRGDKTIAALERRGGAKDLRLVAAIRRWKTDRAESLREQLPSRPRPA